MSLGSYNNCIYASDISSVDATTAHNQVRSKVNQGGYEGQPLPLPGLAPLAWDEALADSAGKYAKGCIWRHSTDRINTGENLYASTNKNASIFDAVDSWADEYKDYDFASATCSAGKQCGHYTQLVWQDTLQVGCASVYCPSLKYEDGSEVFPGFEGATYIVCQYRPAGNYPGRQPYYTGQHTRNITWFDTDTLGLHIPYLLVHESYGNYVSAYNATLFLSAYEPVSLRLDTVQPEQYLEAEEHTNRFDINSMQLFLPDMRVKTSGSVSSAGYGAVLEYHPETPLIFQLKSLQ